MRLIYFPTLILVFVCGCVQIEKYPDSWGSIEPDILAPECSLIKNSYYNRGKKPDGTAVYLAVWLAPETNAKTQEERTEQTRVMDDLFKAKIVELELIDNNILKVRAKGTDIYHQWSFDKEKKQLECKNGILSVLQKGDRSGDNVVAFSSGASDLYFSENNLSVNSHGGVVGITLLIPYTAYGSNWARFEVKE